MSLRVWYARARSRDASACRSYLESVSIQGLGEELGFHPLFYCLDRDLPVMALALIEGLRPDQLEDEEFLAEVGARSTRMSTRRVTEELLRVGLDPNSRWAGATLLHEIATSDSRLDFAELALRHGADLNATDSNEMTPLHVAAMSSQPAMTWWLLKHGANPDLVDLRGLTAVGHAREQMDALPRKGGSVLLDYQWQEDCLKAVRRLLMEPLGFDQGNGHAAKQADPKEAIRP